MAEIGKFFVTLGSKFDAKGVNVANSKFAKFKSSMLSIGKVMAGIGAAGIAMGGLLAAAAFKAAAAAGIQEKAEFLLATALSQTRNETGVTLNELKKYASQLQATTTVGDETSLAVMQLGLNMGVSADQIKGATKQSIGLSKAYGIDLKASMKMVALARQGEFSMLARYIPQLRSTTDKTEQAAIANKAMAEGFGIAEAETKTYAGMVTQLTNQWGDFIEKVGFKVMPIIKELIKYISGSVIPTFERWIDNIAKAVTAVRDFAEKIGLLNKVAREMREDREKEIEQYSEAMKALQKEKDALDKAFQSQKDKAKWTDFYNRKLMDVRRRIHALNMQEQADAKAAADATRESNEIKKTSWLELATSTAESVAIAGLAVKTELEGMSVAAFTMSENIRASLKSSFEEIIKSGGNLVEVMDAMMKSIQNAIISRMATIAADWVTKHAAMKAATIAWAAIEWFAAQAVAVAKIIAGWSTIPFVGFAIGIGAAAAAVSQMAKFKTFAKGVRDFAGGMAMVGEEGPELVNLPRGADVFSAPETRTALAGGGMGDTIIINNPVITSRRAGMDLTRQVGINIMKKVKVSRRI